ncbi:MAG: ROK family protein [Prevotella sp.]
MKENLIGIDIGGTKCAVSYGCREGDRLVVVDKDRFATTEVNETIEHICQSVAKMLEKHQLNKDNTKGIGISCGGPLSSTKGIVMSPPNLIGWDNIPIVKIIEDLTHIPTHLQNDANACALAEYKFGAGRGSRNMVFLTLGTGLGAGIVIDGKLYSGTNDNAGEVGHIRLAEYGPVGYGKRGSFEGFTSGGGIAQIASVLVKEQWQQGNKVPWCELGSLDKITTQLVAEQASKGDAVAKEAFDIAAEYLGRGLSIIIDILNPEVIVIGSIFTRCEHLLREGMQRVIDREALPCASKVCEVRTAALDEQIGDFAALSVAAI